MPVALECCSHKAPACGVSTEEAHGRNLSASYEVSLCERPLTLTTQTACCQAVTSIWADMLVTLTNATLLSAKVPAA